MQFICLSLTHSTIVFFSLSLSLSLFLSVSLSVSLSLSFALSVSLSPSLIVLCLFCVLKIKSPPSLTPSPHHKKKRESICQENRVKANLVVKSLHFTLSLSLSLLLTTAFRYNEVSSEISSTRNIYIYIIHTFLLRRGKL